ncbi:MAG: helix-turn-helix domain-containing protein [Acetatifactor sp.]|nr:helix-turn-helix domain-containing protein [Acetatifactor sp.]
MRDYHFGKFIQELREKRHLSQYQLGMLVGVSDKAVSKWESGASRPQSRILCKLSTVLGVTVDELLTGQHNTFENETAKKTFLRKKELWADAYRSLKVRYGDIPPIEVLNRYLSEYTELQYTDYILYFDLFRLLHARAGDMGEIIRIQGGIGASLAAFVTGASETNPLPPHYYCPRCRRLEFVSDVSDGWDLPFRRCVCGESMIGDGHNLPFETLLPSLHKKVRFSLSISLGMYEAFKEIICSCLAGQTVVILDKKESPDLKTVFIPDREIPDIKSGQELSYEDHYEHFKKYPAITLFLSEELTALSLMGKHTPVPLADVPFTEAGVLEAFCGNNTQGIPEFRTELVREMISETSPHSFHDLIQLLGLAHGIGTWTDSTRRLIRLGLPAAGSIAYRDDIFCCIQDRLTEKGISGAGLASKITEDICRHRYAESGLSAEMRQYFDTLGLESWFADSIEKIHYAFPKAQGIQALKYASILMWYKLHYPEAFKDTAYPGYVSSPPRHCPHNC